jgi:hypothetical protein
MNTVFRMHTERYIMANRLAQVGLLGMVLGGITLFLGLFPFAVGLDDTPGTGVTQIVIIVIALFLIILNAYLIVFALVHRGRPRRLLRDVGLRLGMSGLVFVAAAALADIMGFGSHSSGGGPMLGGLQAAGMLAGFVLSAIGVIIYGSARS